VITGWYRLVGIKSDAELRLQHNTNMVTCERNYNICRFGLNNRYIAGDNGVDL